MLVKVCISTYHTDRQPHFIPSCRWQCAKQLYFVSAAKVRLLPKVKVTFFHSFEPFLINSSSFPFVSLLTGESELQIFHLHGGSQRGPHILTLTLNSVKSSQQLKPGNPPP